MTSPTFQTNGNGFTLVELLIVIGIFSVLTLIALPNFFGTILPQLRLKGAARDIITDMRYARMRAASLNKEYRITFTEAAEQYQVEQGNKSSGSDLWTAEGVVRDFTDADTRYYHSGMDIVSVTSNPVYFKPTGSTTATSITVQNEKGNTAVIRSSIAGRIKME